MAERQTIHLPDGSTAEGVSLPYEVVTEAWHEYALADGGRIRLRLIATRIFKVIDEDGNQKHNPDGSLTFIVSSNVASVIHEP